MSQSRIDRIEAIFDEARQAQGAARAALLDERCGNDDELRAEVESLLAHDGTRGRVLDRTVTPLSHGVIEELVSGGDGEPDAPPRERIGSYRILDVLGEGGMGIVYRAEQVNPRRTVALKVLRPGAGSQNLVRRFEQEAQLLGRLRHPGIAQIYEAGAEDTGHGLQPYFAMELVEGQSIDRFVIDHGLPVTQRLALLAQVCDAVQHAHSRGIVHRDLKPGNVLVTEEEFDSTGIASAGSSTSVGPRVKVLDFGIARVTDADLRTTTIQTHAGQLVGTIAYMSPEQCAADPGAIDERSDVYSLGVMAYELLAGALPYELDGLAIHEAVGVIREQQPRPLGRVDRALGGDVETIISTALEKDPERRYRNAGEFAADIRRYLRSEPIAARPASAIYQLRKFARRHRSLVAAVASVFLVLVAGLITSGVLLVQTSRAEQRAQSALAEANAVNEFITEMLAAANPYSGELHDVSVREVLDVASLTAVGRFRDSPSAEARVREAIAESYMGLGLYDLAVHELMIVQRLRGGSTSRAEWLDLCNTLLYAQIRAQQLDGATGLVYALSGMINPDDPSLRREYLRLQHNRGRLLHAQSNLAPAADVLREAHRLAEQEYGPDEELSLSIASTLALALSDSGQWDEAEAALDHLADAYARRDGANSPNVLQIESDRIDVLRRRGRVEEAMERNDALLERLTSTMGPAHRATIDVARQRANLLNDQSRNDEAEAAFRELLNLARTTLGPDDSLTQSVITELSSLLVELDRPAEAEPLLRNVVEYRTHALGEHHLLTIAAGVNLAQALALQGELEEAEERYRALLDALIEQLGERHPQTLTVMNNLAGTLLRQERAAEAAPIFRRVIDITTELHGGPHREVVIPSSNYARALHVSGDLVAAERAFRDLIELADAVLPEVHWQRYAVRLGHGRCLKDMERYEDAAARIEPTIEPLRNSLGADHRFTRLAIDTLAEIREQLNIADDYY